MNTINIGLIGCGWIMEKAHVPVLASIEGVEIKAVYDIPDTNAAEFGNKHGIPHVFTDFDEFLDSDITAVIIASPNYTHVDYTRQALLKGKHVLCEKPVAFLEAEIREIVELAEQNGLIYLPGFVNRFRLDVKKFYQLFTEGKAGELAHIEASWIRKSGVPNPGSWFTNRKFSGGGVLTDLGSHIVDICTMFTQGKEVSEASLTTVRTGGGEAKDSAGWFQTSSSVLKAEIDVERTAVGQVKHSDGTTMIVKVSWAEDVENDYTHIVLTGTKGRLEMKTLFGFSNQRLWDKDEIMLMDDRNSETLVLNRETNHAFQAFYALGQYFIDQIRDRSGTYLSAKDAIASVALIEKMYSNETVVECFPAGYFDR
ncbi:Gfo/Idh/MocA family protein [Paenibacillus tepidiphilus]|uniref:Gfo/Idh/MocA family protein n=1 Tax=Paenibacillus tepidiphilus TaxID=2608683 RepID=UPI00123AA8DD|nr:Gfo/Idh/MocA family oxidoreductase [Paenibacillus tepidiphilus]